MKPLATILLLAGATAGGMLLGESVAPTMLHAKAAPPPVVAAASVPVAAAAAAKPSYTPIRWDDLTPKDWDPLKQFRDANFGAMSDADPRAIAMLQRMRETWDNAPTNNALDGQAIRIAGYLVPLDETKAGLTNFLLVPYFGACIHTPPPPSNQIIDVTPKAPSKGWRPMDTVWVSGTLRTLRSETYMGVSSYRMEAVSVEPYAKEAKDGAAPR